ncbi:unnamed protein product [Acanthoscelides obtectus]|uniref:Uncharacterized protein n=1 Tax=Acanthoscelides obtectus TaxID=200917 RepID=A0A9P0LII1_ACAOB|nr:unnamed protein product [Acanthoscelides obtectus]CAK1683298.1 hypothetical protein AOBTE_LOCUS34189 [Acanthoscelides obtectus]
MLRNVLSRLPGLTSLPESCRPATAKALTRALSPQVDTSVFNRSRRLRQNEGTRLTRSHSVPPPTKRYEHYHYGRFNENEDLQTKEYKYERKLADKEDLSESGSKQRKLTEVMSEMTYELEAAKPKRSKSCIDFDAFKQIEDQSFEQEMLDHLQPSMLKPFGSSQTYSPNTFRCRPQSYTKPVFRMNEALEGNVKSREDARDTISENHRRAFSTNSLPNEHEYGNKLMDTISESGSTAVSMKKGQRSYSQRSKPATKLNQKIESCISNLEQVAAEPAITSSPPEKEHIFDPIINNLLAAKKNNMTRYNPSLEDVSINPPPFLEKLKYNVTTDAYVTPPAEILPKEKVMERHQMQSHKKGMENMQKRAISTSEGPLMMKSATVLAVQEKLRPSKMLDCPPEKTEKQPEESIKMAPDGRKCFLPSKVRLPVPECMPRPKHVCPPPPCKRADECLKILPKRLPFIPDGPCVCVEPYLPHVAPPMKRLDLSAEEPERVCPSPPCPQPRADDNMPHKPKQLKPYVPKPCACVEPPPMIDVPLKRLPPMCPPEEHERCFPERICPEEVCERADENLCVRPKKLPALVPKDCPSIEPEPMTDVRLKRLDLTMPEPPRICPCVEVCPCPRADDNYKPKHKPLRKIVPGDCPCIEPEYKDVHFKRLECIDEPEPCDVVDPCIPYPRADYGCWEYYTPPTPCEEIKKKRKSKKPVPRRMNFKPSTRCYSVQPRKNNFRDSADRLKSSTFTKLFKTNSVKAEEKVEKEQPLIPSMTNVVKKKAKPKTVVPNTVILLDQLNTLEKELSKDTIHFEPQKSNKIDIRKIMTSISAFEKESATKTAQRATVRNLSTTMATKLSSVPNTSEKVDIKVGQHGIKTTASTRKDDKCAKSNFCPKKERPCPKGPRLTPMKNCPSGERRPSCQRRRPINCCQKPPPPYPSFSELMDEEIEPFSEHAEWTCKRKECGFHPKTTKEFEPLNEKKHKKCYSTMTFNVKKLVDEQPDDLKSERGALGNDSSAKGPRSQRLDNGRFVRKLFQQETKERKSIAQCPSSISENCHVIRNTGCHLVLSCPTTSIRRYSSNTNSFTRTYASESEKDKKTSVRICRIQHEKPRCQGKCPKFDYPHCPEKTDKRCDVKLPND